jgi:diamine N-acetyltransferase
MPEIKTAAVKDIPLIQQLAYAIWPQTYSSIISKAQISYMLDMIYSTAALQKQMHDEGCTFIIVYDNNQPVAFASYNQTTLQTWKLSKIYILPTQQGKGTGKFIISYIIDTIKMQNAKALQLQVNRFNKACNFYQKLGFTIIETADFDIGNGYFMDDYVMQLVI